MPCSSLHRRACSTNFMRTIVSNCSINGFCLLLLGLSCCGPDVDAQYRAQPGRCDGLGEFCEGGGLCCPGMFCGFDTCCVESGNPCEKNTDCCSSTCQDGMCTRSSYGGWCRTAADCRQGLICNESVAFCEAPPGGYCRSSNDCLSADCELGTCACSSCGAECTGPSDCCSGLLCCSLGSANGDYLGATCLNACP
jgi:hypothetical protein